MEILLLTYNIVRRVPVNTIHEEHHFDSLTVIEWAKICRVVMLEHMLGSSTKTGGPNETVEIDDSKFDRRKYNRGHKVKGQWFFGGVERESENTFLVPLMERTAETFLLTESNLALLSLVTASPHTRTYKPTVTHT
jgi:hypothetical protein